MIDNELLKHWIKNGVSLDKNLKPITKKSGYMVSKLGYEKTHAPRDINGIKSDIMTYKHIIKKNEYIGLWLFDGKIYVDISRHYTSKQKAIITGVKNKQYSIYNLSNGQEIPLMTKTYTLYKYNALKNDIVYIKEYYTKNDMIKDLKMNYHTLSQYIIDSIDKPIKSLINNKYLLVSNYVYIRDLEES